ncbi:hypothetical protein GCM10023336_48490 [Streptomyces similanensis]|uniref:Uncharacterized protein n=1 Tax=Streptomyces similanensis TaxID=1274988 RepID=A0ABP9KV92_9ACTN
MRGGHRVSARDGRTRLGGGRNRERVRGYAFEDGDGERPAIVLEHHEPKFYAPNATL